MTVPRDEGVTRIFMTQMLEPDGAGPALPVKSMWPYLSTKLAFVQDEDSSRCCLQDDGFSMRSALVLKAFQFESIKLTLGKRNNGIIIMTVKGHPVHG